jgi:hypothetical protein
VIRTHGKNDSGDVGEARVVRWRESRQSAAAFKVTPKPGLPGEKGSYPHERLEARDAYFPKVAARGAFSDGASWHRYSLRAEGRIFVAGITPASFPACATPRSDLGYAS